MLNRGDIVKVISTTEWFGEPKEFIPIGSVCRIVNIDDSPSCGVAYCLVPCNASTGYEGYWYLESEVEEGHLEWVKGKISKEDKYVSVVDLVRTFEDMANRGSLLAGSDVSQQDLLIQIKGAILHVAMGDTYMKNNHNRKEIS